MVGDRLTACHRGGQGSADELVGQGAHTCREHPTGDVCNSQVVRTQDLTRSQVRGHHDHCPGGLRGWLQGQPQRPYRQRSCEAGQQPAMPAQQASGIGAAPAVISTTHGCPHPVSRDAPWLTRSRAQ